ncbi:MAG: hypothetical protein ABJL55_11825 [Roseibium sp.]
MGGSEANRDGWVWRTRPVATAFRLAVCILPFLVSSVTAKDYSNSLSSLGVMTCQQLWYVEQEVLAEGRICPKSERAQQAFASNKNCISGDERILPNKVLEYLEAVRNVARSKTCSGF